MSFSHVYYTSAQSDHYGFQVIAKASDIHNVLEEERIVKVSAYSLPVYLKQQQNELHVLQEAPRKFAFYPLKSERFAMTNVVYSGKDYSGRTGNFFADTVVFQPCALKGRAIDYVASPSFHEQLADDKTNTHVATTLTKSNVVTLHTIRAFLSQPGRLHMYKAMLQAVLTFSETRKSVIIIDDASNVAQWIGAISYSLPERFSWNIPFTTYTHQYSFEHPDAIIFGVDAKETPQHAWHQQFYVFDTVRNEMPQQLLTHNDYVEAVSTYMMTNDEAYVTLLNFIDLICEDEQLATIDHVIPLYEFTHREIEQMSAETLEKGLRRYLQITNEETLHVLADSILRQVSADENDCYDLYVKLPPTLVPPLSLRWLQVGKGHVGMKDLAMQFFYTSWENLMINDRDEQYVTMIEQFTEQAMALNKGNVAFHKKGYDIDRLQVLVSVLDDEPRQLLWSYWIRCVYDHLQENKVDIQNSVQQKAWFFKMFEKGFQLSFSFDDIFHLLFDDERYVEEVLVQFMNAYYKAKNEPMLQQVLQHVYTYVEKHERIKPLFNKYFLDKLYVQAFLKNDRLQQISESTYPATILNNVMHHEKEWLAIREEEVDLFVLSAAERLLQIDDEHFLPQLHIFYTNEDNMQHSHLAWAKYVMPAMNTDLMEKAIEQIVNDLQQYEYVATITNTIDLLEDKEDDRFRTYKEKLQIITYLYDVVQRQQAKSLQPLIEQLETQHESVVTAIYEQYVPSFVRLMIRENDVLLPKLLPTFERVYVKEAIRLATERPEPLALYVKHQLNNALPIQEAVIEFYKAEKSVMKSTEALFKSMNDVSTDAFKQAVKGTSALSKIGSKMKNMFSKKDSEE